MTPIPTPIPIRDGVHLLDSRIALSSPVYQGAIRLDGPGERYLVTYAAGYPTTLRTVVACVRRHEGQAMVDLEGEADHDEAIRFALLCEVGAGRRA